MSKIMVANIKPGDAVDADFMVGEVMIADTSNGKKMARMELSDKSGKIGCVMWDYPADLSTATRGEQLLKSGEVVRILGSAGEYKGKAQLIVSNIYNRVSTTDEAFERVSKYGIDDMWYEFMNFVHGFESPSVRRVAQDIALDEARSARFRGSPAATGMHHAFKGGLLEHTLQMLQSGEALLKLPCYAEVLNRDLCLFGLMFHDFSKIYEYHPSAGFKKTMHGVLVGHISKTCALIEVSCDKLGIDEEIKDHLQHVILAHHGRIDYGSPVDMATPEAMFVHFIDHLHGDVFGTVQKFETEVQPGTEIWKHNVTRKNMIVRRFTDILKEKESQ